MQAARAEHLSSSSDPDITSSADAGILCRPLHPVPSAPGPLFSSTALRRLSEGLSTNSYGHREERGARTIVAGQNSSGVALPKRQPKRADFCPISPATILCTVCRTMGKSRPYGKGPSPLQRRRPGQAWPTAPEPLTLTAGPSHYFAY